jgi:hypothetical protein
MTGLLRERAELDLLIIREPGEGLLEPYRILSSASDPPPRGLQGQGLIVFEKRLDEASEGAAVELSPTVEHHGPASFTGFEKRVVDEPDVPTTGYTTLFLLDGKLLGE